VTAASGRLKGFTLTLVYVTGMAFTYSLLGVAASLTGQLFGRVSSHPLTYLCVGLIFIIFGLSMLDLFTIPFISLGRLGRLKNKGYLSGFILGVGSGLVLGPCLTAILGPILAYLATRKNTFYGASLLLTFAYGQGLIFILAGTFSSMLVSLPGLNRWLPLIKKVSAVILMAVGLYFIYAALRRIW
jgi:thiol:disulfide interchange protein DsbD